MTVTAPQARLSSMRATIDDLATMLSEDGAALDVMSLDEVALSAEIAVHLADLDCEDCVLPPDRLHAVISAALARSVGAPVSVLLHDPREPQPIGTPAHAATTHVPFAGGTYLVLDPTGVAPDDGDPDHGPDVGAIAGKTVAIRHDVLWPAFDWTVEEWRRLFEERGATVLMFARAQGEKDDVLAASDARFEAMLASADLVVSGLANCGSCTSWSVRDAIIARGKGLPATVVATAHFEPLAAMLSAEGGRSGMRLTVLPYPYSTLDEATVRGMARQAFPQLLQVVGAH